jgi:hypothetical protein
MPVSNLAEQRLINALASFCVAAGNGQDTSEKAEELRRVIRNTDDATIDAFVGPKGVSIDEAVQSTVKFGRAVIDFAEMVTRIRR